MNSFASIILAAGQGKRMKSSLPKVLHPIAGKPLLVYSLELVRQLGIAQQFLILGYQAQQVKQKIKENLTGVKCIYQNQQLGTGHAVLQAQSNFSHFSGSVLILSGDVPLLQATTIRKMIDYHQHNQQACTLLTAQVENPIGYGRIIRDSKGNISEIVEQADLTLQQETIQEINSGIYCFDATLLFESLQRLTSNNQQQEYYLTDVIKIMLHQGHVLGCQRAEEESEIAGINTREDLSRVSHIIYQQNNKKHMAKGVTILDPASTFIDDKVEIGQDTVIYPFTVIEQDTKIGQHCIIGPSAHLKNVQVGHQTKINSSVLEFCCVGDEVTIGPYAHIRPESMIHDQSKIGNFVEIKKSSIGKGSKASHLTYLGDTQLGEKVNIGAGTITCNYDGKNKHRTQIGDGVFIGSNNALVAPVKIGHSSYTAAGSTITRDVPEGSLGIARSRQKNIIGWSKRKSEKSED